VCKKVITFIITIISICACSSIKPNYQAKINKYTLHHFKNTTFESTTLIYTYNTESLEKNYHAIFCSQLSNCEDNINNVKNTQEFGGFDLNKSPIKNNPYNIKTIDLFRITYSTTGQLNESEIVSGGIYYPNMPKDKIKGVVLFFHPTFFAKSSVNTYAPQNKVNRSLAALFAAQGYIVVTPDYIGMGYNKKQVHPYVLYPQINAIDGLSILTAAKKFLTNESKLPNNLNKTPLYLTGYSEGSAYALWFSRLYQEQPKFKTQLDKINFDLKLVAPISGAYNLSGVIYNYLFSNNNTFNKSEYAISNSLISGSLKAPLAADALVSYAYYSESSNYNNVFNPEFFSMGCTLQFDSSCSFNNKKLNLEQAFAIESKDLSIPVADNLLDVLIVNKINNAASYKTNNNHMFTIWTNSIYPLVSTKLLHNSQLEYLMREGDVYYWKSDIPTTLITLKRDSVVSPINTEFAYRGMTENYSTNINKIEIDNNLIDNKLSSAIPSMEVDHLTGLFYLFIIAQKQFDLYNHIKN
jgi:hypothetical protein